MRQFVITIRVFTVLKHIPLKKALSPWVPTHQPWVVTSDSMTTKVVLDEPDPNNFANGITRTVSRLYPDAAFTKVHWFPMTR